MMVLCLAGACVAAVLAVASASAALPELGRCVPEPAGKGVFNRNTCIGVSKTHKGAFEWAPGPGASPAVTEVLSAPTFETVGGRKIGCANIQLKGEYTGAKSEKITNLTMQGCTNVGRGGTECFTNPVEPGTIESEVPLVGELGSIPGSLSAASPWAGWDLKAENSATPIVTFTCGEALSEEVVMLEGSVIGRAKKTNKMVPTFEFLLKQTAGKQIPSSFIGGAEDVLTQVSKPVGGTTTTTEQVGLVAAGELKAGESLEIKAKV
jgi:hypothetical protein